jgi:hypothetical protein
MLACRFNNSHLNSKVAKSEHFENDLAPDADSRVNMQYVYSARSKSEGTFISRSLITFAAVTIFYHLGLLLVFSR